jgi:hypothetical protein
VTLVFAGVAREGRGLTYTVPPTAARLLASSRLLLDADRPAGDLLREALPTGGDRWTGRPLGVITARADGASAPAAPERAHTLRVGGVRAWTDTPVAGETLLMNGARTVHAVVDRNARRAMIRVIPALEESERDDVRVAFGLAVTLLIGHVGHAVVHAAAVVAPNGGAWLLAGDSRAGKSSTTAALVAAGWDYLSDDSVVLSPARSGDPSGISVEGWRSGFSLDRGWRDGVSTGDRVETEANAIGGGKWRPAAPLAGVLFPRVDASSPTALGAISQANAFVELVRQSPWLLADRGSAPAVAALLCHAAVMPAARLSLGADSYARPERLVEVLSAIVAGG